MLVVVHAWGLTTLAAAPPSNGKRPAASPPNIVLIISDDQGMGRFLVHGPSAHPNAQSRSPGKREPDIYARVRAVEFVLPEPGFDHHGPLSASAQGHEQRSDRSEGNEARPSFENRLRFRKAAKS